MFKLISRSFSTNPAQWFLRAYEQQDAARIKEIALPVIHDLVSAPPSLTIKQREELYQNEVQRALESSAFKTVVISDGCNTVVGFVTYHLSNECLVRPTAVIEHLAVDPLYRDQKLGTALLERSIQELNELGARFISLRITNEKIAPFYERKGFQITRHPELRWGNAGIMVKMLHRSPRPIMGPMIDRFSRIEKLTLIKTLLATIGVAAAFVLENKSSHLKRQVVRRPPIS
jgi:ribosomal protein S18 acetylase RimI-like enzyme